jgi:hypothetical protein
MKNNFNLNKRISIAISIIAYTILYLKHQFHIIFSFHYYMFKEDYISMFNKLMYWNC